MKGAGNEENILYLDCPCQNPGSDTELKLGKTLPSKRVGVELHGMSWY
jgi:hypothetical protein